MTEVISKVLNGEPSLILFHDSQPNRLVLSNSEADQTVIPYDLLPESQHNGAAMVDVVACVRHLVKTIRELEAENAHLKRTADLLAEELSTVEIPPAVCDGCRERDMFGKYSCGGKDCIYWMFSRKARGEKK